MLKVRALDALGKRDAAKIELRSVKEGLVRYASMPLRLAMAETSVQLGGTNAAADYQEARNLLQGLPGYARAFAIHQFGSRLSPKDSSAALQAQRMATQALGDLLANTPATQQQILTDYATSIGVTAEQTP